MINLNDYIYDIEAEQYSFLRVPKILIQHEAYRGLSADAKMLYSLLLDRAGISIQNGWKDEYNRVYIIFSIEEIKRSLNCGKNKAIQLLQELEEKADLIERKKQGLCKPNLIYVKSFIRTVDESGAPNFLKFDNKTSGSLVFKLPEVSKSNPNNTNNNKTYSIKTTEGSEAKRIIGIGDYYSFFKERLEYSSLLEEYPLERERLEGIFELLVETCTSKKETIRIAGDEKPAADVKRRLMQLEACHIEYVLDCLNENTTDIKDIKQYLLTTLYNAVITKGPYYHAKVNHDLYRHQKWGGDGIS